MPNSSRLLALACCFVACACSKKSEEAPPTKSETPVTSDTAGAGSPSPAASPAAAAGDPAPAAPGAGAGPKGGGTTIAQNDNGKVQVNDAGTVTTKRADGDTVVTGKDGVTKANGVVVDPKKGTVTIPGQGTYKTQ
jgi:hypothetical protein